MIGTDCIFHNSLLLFILYIFRTDRTDRKEKEKRKKKENRKKKNREYIGAKSAFYPFLRSLI
jgi:hypothetical protein